MKNANRKPLMLLEIANRKEKRMKTLDEVIVELESYPVVVGTTLTFDVIVVPERSLNDALHYLKEYKTLQYGYIKAMADLEDNPALSWDELKQMEGRPVWIEAVSLSVGVSPYWKDWYIIKSFSNDEFMYCNDGFEWAKEMQGRLWQAYRKER